MKATLCCVVAMWALTGCGEAAAPTEASLDGPRLSVDVAALNLTGVGDVVWDVEVSNGASTPAVVWQRRLSSSGYGDGAGSASYVGPCDADAAAQPNTVRVWVVGAYSAPVSSLGTFASGAAGGVAGTSVPFQNPTTAGPLTQTVTCRENSDVAVQFDVALMRPAQQGFFDVAVNFDDIFCSAKLDCCRDDGDDGSCDGDITLLFEAAGQRGPTMVLGFACTAGARADVETELYLDALQLDCTDPASGFTADLTIDPSGDAGNQCIAGSVGGGDCAVVAAPGGLDADDYLFQIGVYRGFEDLQSAGAPAQKVYWNVALGVRRPAIAGCWLRARGTADDAQGSPAVDAGEIAAGTVYPFIQWDADLGTCASEPLTFGDPSASVRTEYTGTGDPLTAFAFGFGPNLAPGSFCGEPCVHGICTSGVCSCDLGYSGSTCAVDDDDCVGDPCDTVGGAGVCVDAVASYSCDCNDGFYGDGTESCTACTPIDHCQSGLTCSDASDETCAVCEAGYSGPSCVDTAPDAFTIPAATSAPPSTITTSSVLALTSFDPGLPVSVSGDGSPELSVDGGPWVTAATLNPGQTLELRATSGASWSETIQVTLTAGDVVATWDITTEAQCPGGCTAQGVNQCVCTGTGCGSCPAGSEGDCGIYSGWTAGTASRCRIPSGYALVSSTASAACYHHGTTPVNSGYCSYTLAGTLSYSFTLQRQ